MPPDPWLFGWTQLFTIFGFVITIFIAVSGFRTFDRWKKEKLEEKRIDIAIDALALTYECKYIFDHIRSELAYSYEWDAMPITPGDNEAQRQSRGPFYAVLKRIEANKEFFDRAWKLQVRCTAVFGAKAEETFLIMQKARREIEVSAGMLFRDPYPTNDTEDNRKTWDGWRANVWPAHGPVFVGRDQVGEKLSEFRSRMEKLCRPIIDREYGRPRRIRKFPRSFDILGGTEDRKISLREAIPRRLGHIWRVFRWRFLRI